ncbi:MAG: helix-hairpin-helix domain-containing protein [Desulfobacterales bacterium]|jgi:hypothetical protein
MKPTNHEIADVLARIADLLEAQDANRYRVGAYRRAAGTIRDLSQSIAEMAVSSADEKLTDLPDIGTSIAGAVKEYVKTGRSSLLERLEGRISSEELFTTVPGIGDKIARRIQRHLDIDTLEELELAAFDGRLKTVSGIGHRRVNAIRDSVAAILNRSSRRRARRARRLEKAQGSDDLTEYPPVSTILDVDARYRRLAKAGELKTIAPRRFNPEGTSWLPIMHVEKNGWQFTALFSNTARAHDLNKTQDWVVIYFERDGEEDQYTVVTEPTGPLKGRRVVRGREKDCHEYYKK